MEFLLPVVEYLKANSDLILAALVAVVAAGEAITRLTPTEADDGFVKRLGGLLDKLLKFLPNNIKRPPQA